MNAVDNKNIGLLNDSQGVFVDTLKESLSLLGKNHFPGATFVEPQIDLENFPYTMLDEE